MEYSMTAGLDEALERATPADLQKVAQHLRHNRDATSGYLSRAVADYLLDVAAVKVDEATSTIEREKERARMADALRERIREADTVADLYSAASQHRDKVSFLVDRPDDPAVVGRWNLGLRRFQDGKYCIMNVERTKSVWVEGYTPIIDIKIEEGVTA